MKKIDTRQAVGHVLCHDITRIVPGEMKDAQFRKGHVVREEDIPVLLSMGKEHLFVWENNESMLHENDAAEILLDLCLGLYMSRSQVKEGKIEIFADVDGLFEADVERLNKVNGLGEMMIATRGNRFPVKKGDKLAGTRIIPLVIEKEKMEVARKVAGKQPLLKISPYRQKKIGIIGRMSQSNPGGRGKSAGGASPATSRPVTPAPVRRGRSWASWWAIARLRRRCPSPSASWL